ncbi:helix-turn-helix domain-containing protein [Nonomuraea sp. NPDC003754]
MWWAAKHDLLKVDDPRADRAVTLYRDEGRTLREIAAELGCTPRRVTIWLRGRGVELDGPGAPVRHR